MPAKNVDAPGVLAPGSVLTWNPTGQALNVYKLPGTATGSNTFDTNSFTAPASACRPGRSTAAR